MQYDVATTETFDSWLDGLRDHRAAVAITNSIIKLENGLFGNVEPVGEGVSEMKIDIGAGYRCYFVTRDRTLIVLLMGGDKSTQKRDIAKAKEMAAQLD